MQLTKLEIKGFKSFGDKVIINFNEGITGIVGPNGSGKSNIVDAIRWVLGEQKTRMLRSDKMENIIFNGTKKRKPTQLAEVSLTFDNTKNILPTEYSIVTISRRYYRSGESDYELNGISCRLKDITNLFLDTGIASNSYAIIELKMVDDLLADKDNSRRGLFEEAAGISKFKKRKNETLRKLNSTDVDLERVEDLIYEIEKNLKSLEKQAKQTKKYYILKEQYKELSISYARVTIQEQSDAFDRISKQISAENDRKVGLMSKISEMEVSIQLLKSKVIINEKKLSEEQKRLNDHVNSIRQYESDKEIKNERLRYLNDKLTALKEQIEQDKNSNKRAAFSINNLKQEKEIAIRQLEEVRKKLAATNEEKQQQENNVSTVREENDVLTSLLSSKQTEVFQIRKTIEINQIQVSALKQQLEKAASDSSEQSASIIEFDKKTQEINKAIAIEKEKLTKLQKEDDALKERIMDSDATIKFIKEELADISRHLDARQNEFNLTKSLVENLEGFPEAIKFLKRQANWNGKAPLLSDLITCDDTYKVSIENFLEPYLNYYVVQKEADAYMAINLLSDAAKGKAHFFILNSFKNLSPAPGKLFENAFPVTEVIEFDTKFKNLIAHILENVYLVNGDETSIPVDSDAIFITKSGKITKRKHSIAGGSIGLFEGKKIGRVKNLEKLGKEIKRLTTQHTKIEASLNEQENSRNDLDQMSFGDSIEKIKIHVTELNEKLIAVQSRQQQFNELISQAHTDKNDLLNKIELIEANSKSLQPQLADEEKKLQSFDTKLNIARNELNVTNEKYRDVSSLLNEENIRFHQQQNQVHSLEQELDFKQNAFDSSKSRIDSNTNDLNSCQEEIKKLLTTAELSDDQLIAMYAAKESLEANVNSVEKKYYKSRGVIDEAEKEQRENQHQRETIDDLLIDIHQSLNDTKLELSATKERLSVEFNVDLDEILKIKDESKDVHKSEEELKEKVQNLKDKIDRIGPVNPMARDAYDEIQERHEFILSQKEDLINAKESLLTTINEIDLVAEATFLDSFGKIKANFVRVFRSLFTEHDDCDLSLTDPGNPLESGIAIMAKPKGKKPVSINQLSGGEKTLTATALLFAIYLLKPAPFCIFDEVDAPLDDANIDKFNQIIKQFSKESQFIIVTHNKRTMEQTDVIYGITMVEQGVSKVVPVDLRALA